MSETLKVTIKPSLPKTVDRSIAHLIRRQEPFVNDLTRFGRRSLRSILLRAPKSVVSQPGEPPIRKSGKFNKSIEIHAARGFGNITVGSVGPTVHYAKYLEGGTSRMAARPFKRITESNITRHAEAAAKAAFES